MPFNGSGTFSIVNLFVPNTTILSASVNQNFSDIATGLSDCLTRDGQAGMTAVFKAITGSSGAPSISFTSDTKTGLFLSATGVLGLVANALGIKVNSEIFAVASAAISAGGSGYVVGDTITETGGTFITPTVYTVATLSGSAVATVTVTVPGIYTVKPSSPVSQGSTSGAGTGATFTPTWNDPTSSDYKLGITDLADAALWTKLGSSSFVAGLMGKANGLDFANGIGATNIVQVISGSFVIPPQGILSPINSANAPIPLGDNTAVTRIYWLPYEGSNNCPIYNGTAMVNTTSGIIFADLTAGAQVSGGIFDVYKFLVSGTVTLGLSPSWLAGTSGSVTAGSCARGSGTGGAALTWFPGIGVPTNAAAMTLNNGATTYSIPINQATCLGSIYINGTAGQYNCYRSYGQSRVWGLFNFFNRVPISLKAGDSTASWNYTTNTFRASNGSSANSLTVFQGLAEDVIDLQFVNSNENASSAQITQSAIGWNSTSVASGSIAQRTCGGATLSETGGSSLVLAKYSQIPSLGINVATCLEKSGAAGTTTWYGAESKMCLTAAYKA